MNLRSATYHTANEAVNGFSGFSIRDEVALEDEGDITTDYGDDTVDRFDSDDDDEFDPSSDGDNVMADHYMDVD
jgi:hypothetical protein